MSWGHALRALTEREQLGLGCSKCRNRATNEATFLTAGRHGGAALTNRLRFCVDHARGFAERNRIDLPAVAETAPLTASER